MQQCAQEDVAAGSNKRESISQPAHLISMQIYIFFPPYLGPPFEFFFSVPGGPTHAETLLNATTVVTQIDPTIWSERVSTCKSTKQTVRESCSKRAGAPGSRGGLLPAAATWSWPLSPCWGRHAQQNNSGPPAIRANWPVLGNAGP